MRTFNFSYVIIEENLVIDLGNRKIVRSIPAPGIFFAIHSAVAYVEV